MTEGLLKCVVPQTPGSTQSHRVLLKVSCSALSRAAVHIALDLDPKGNKLWWQFLQWGVCDAELVWSAGRTFLIDRLFWGFCLLVCLAFGWGGGSNAIPSVIPKVRMRRQHVLVLGWFPGSAEWAEGGGVFSSLFILLLYCSLSPTLGSCCQYTWFCLFCFGQATRGVGSSALTREQACTPALETQSLNYRTFRKVLSKHTFNEHLQWEMVG